jgi:cytoskeletal protein CcmA (bactofilin family)
MAIFGKPADNKPSEPAPPPRPSPPPAAAAAPSAAPRPAATGSACVIGVKTTIKGDINGDEDVLVEGAVEGQIKITRDLRIGPGGSVKATVEAHSVIVSGELSGDCSATNRVEIQATGRLTGNIRAPKVIIAEGALFKGNSDMSGRGEKE